MTAVAWLRGAAAVTLLLGIGHMIGSPWTPVSDEPGRQLVEALHRYHFDAMGLQRSYEDFYGGFGWMLGAYLVAHAILFWQLAVLVRAGMPGLRAVVGVLALEYAVIAALAGRFLFWVPLGLAATIAVLLAAGAWSLGRRPVPAAA